MLPRRQSGSRARTAAADRGLAAAAPDAECPVLPAASGAPSVQRGLLSLAGIASTAPPAFGISTSVGAGASPATKLPLGGWPKPLRRHRNQRSGRHQRGAFTKGRRDSDRGKHLAHRRINSGEYHWYVAAGCQCTQIIDLLGVFANKNAPPIGFDPVENDCRRCSRGHRGHLAKECGSHWTRRWRGESAANSSRKCQIPC
jgi:hypothetical protein